MCANFRLSAKDFYSVVDTIGGNYAGLYAVLVAGWDIEKYCAAHTMQKRHVLSRVEKVRAFLENGKPAPNATLNAPLLDRG